MTRPPKIDAEALDGLARLLARSVPEDRIATLCVSGGPDWASASYEITGDDAVFPVFRRLPLTREGERRLLGCWTPPVPRVWRIFPFSERWREEREVLCFEAG